MPARRSSSSDVSAAKPNPAPRAFDATASSSPMKSIFSVTFFHRPALEQRREHLRRAATFLPEHVKRTHAGALVAQLNHCLRVRDRQREEVTRHQQTNHHDWKWQPERKEPAEKLLLSRRLREHRSDTQSKRRSTGAPMERNGVDEVSSDSRAARWEVALTQASRFTRQNCRKASTDRAVSRPSAIAHTIRLAPRMASPALKTPGMFVCQSVPTFTLPRASRLT